MTPGEALSAWTLDPGVVLALASTGVLLWVGTRRDRQRHRPLTTRRSTTLAASGLGVLALALLSPVDAAATTLVSAHMVQHLLLGLVAPLLLVGGSIATPVLGGLPRGLRRGAAWWRHRLHLARVRRHPVAVGLGAVALHAGSFWVWHLPPLYDAAVEHDVLHALEHGTLLGGGLALWYSVLGACRRRRAGWSVVVLFLAGLTSGALAALLTLAPRPLYQAQPALVETWGLTRLSDQELAGALMWVVGGLVYLVSAVVIFVRWLDGETIPSRGRGTAIAGPPSPSTPSQTLATTP